MGEGKRSKILVIDGDRTASSMIVDTLTARGSDVYATADPDEGIEKAAALAPDLIFISLLFPESNGLKVSKQIHSVEGLKKVPVVMLISYQGELDPKYTSTIGIVDVLVKPLKREDLISKTVNILGKKALSEGIAEELPVKEEREILAEEEIAGLHHEAGEFSAGTVEISVGEGLMGPESGSDDMEGLHKGEDNERRGPAFTGEELTSDELSQKSFVRKGFLIGAAVLIIAVGLGAYGMKKVLSRAGSRMRPLSAAGTEPVRSETEKKEQVKEQAAEPAPKKNQLKAGESVLPASTEKTVAAGGPSRSGGSEEKKGPPAPGITQKNKSGSDSLAGAPAPKTVKRTSPEESGFSVQAGAFSSEKNAASLVEKLKKKGYDAFAEKDSGRPIYRVLVGRFVDRRKASEQARLLEKEGIKSIIYRSKG
jgi:DedD protein